MRPLKLFRRADDRPSLKDRAAALRTRLAGLTRRRDGETDPQRHVMVAGTLAVALPLPAFARAAVTEAHPDAALLALGARFDALAAAYLDILPAFTAAQAAAAEATDAALAGRRIAGTEAQDAVRKSAERPFAAMLERGYALQGEIDRLADTIVKRHRPQTLQGAAVTARVAAEYFRDLGAHDPDALAWDDRLTVELIAAVLRVAGIENPAAPPSA